MFQLRDNLILMLAKYFEEILDHFLYFHPPFSYLCCLSLSFVLSLLSFLSFFPENPVTIVESRVSRETSEQELYLFWTKGYFRLGYFHRLYVSQSVREEEEEEYKHIVINAPSICCCFVWVWSSDSHTKGRL